MSILDIQNLHITVGSQTLVDGVSLQLEAGQTLCLVGESGSGKTLSGLSVMGLLAPELSAKADVLKFEDYDILSLTPKQHRKLRGAQMSMIFQEPLSALNPVMKVGEQVAEVFKIHTNLNKRERFAKVVGLFEKVQLDNPAERYHQYPHQLSGGQRQRVMIAMALALQPKLLIADEPTTALDATVQGEILKLIKELQQEFGTAVLFITHDFGVVQHIADHVAVMEHGKLVEHGTAKQVLGKPQHAYAKRLLKASPKLNTKRKAAVKGAELLTATTVQKTFTRSGGLFQRKGPLVAVNNASFVLKEGETLGIVGESGSGKSTLARCIMRLYDPDTGVVQFGAHGNIANLKGKPLKAMRRDMQMVFQDPFASLNPRMKIGPAVREGLDAHNIGTKQERDETVQQLLKACGLPEDAAQRYPHQFSGGQRQRIGIARALALNPKLLVADEPVASLDVSVQAQILELLAQLKKDYQLSMIFISHDLRVVSQVADTVAVMRHGQIVEHGPVHEVFENPQQPYTQQLLDALPS